MAADAPTSGHKLQLEDVIQDVKMSEAFLTFLRASYMSVSYELWLEIIKYETVCVDDETRTKVYVEMMERFFVKGCNDPMSLPALIANSITQYYDEIDKTIKGEVMLPEDLFAKAKEELWMLLCWTCLPAFQLSETYKDYENGKKVETRKKAENVFGETMKGSMVKSEIVRHSGNQTTRSYEQQKQRLQLELDYQKSKTMDMGDVMLQATKGGLFKRIDLDEVAGGDSGDARKPRKDKEPEKKKKKKKKITKFHPIYGEIRVYVTDDEEEEGESKSKEGEKENLEVGKNNGEKESDLGSDGVKKTGDGQAVGLWEMFEYEYE